VGKTATTLGLASAIGHRGGTALVIDMDPQANATNGLGVYPVQGQLTTADLMAAMEVGAAAKAVVPTNWPGVDLIPGHRDLANAQNSGDADVVFRLDVSLEGLDLSGYDAVLIDCAPTLGKLLYAALVAADGVLIVTEPSRDGLKGVQEMVETMQRIKMRPNPRLELEKIILSRYTNCADHSYREAELREGYGELVARTGIPNYAARADAHSAEIPIHQLRRGKALALQLAYEDLLDELGIKIGERV
jgi:cellulose biosynthesis protein BcsQ